MGPWEDRIKQIEQKLDAARRAIISLMPEDVETLLLSYIEAETRDDFRRWEHDVSDKLLKRAKAFNQAFGSASAYCPLCRKGTSAP